MNKILLGLMLCFSLSACNGGTTSAEGDDSANGETRAEPDALHGCVWTGGTLGWRCNNPGVSCGDLRGNFCYNGGSKPDHYEYLGQSYDCRECLYAPSCGELGGDLCYNGGGFPIGYSTFGSTYDCRQCLIRSAE